jgi:hypothetical protein
MCASFSSRRRKAVSSFSGARARRKAVARAIWESEPPPSLPFPLLSREVGEFLALFDL